MGRFKKMLFGERMPDKNDPQYKERYDKEVEAGQQFAKKMKIDKLAAIIQRFANSHRHLFLFIVFGFLGLCLALNVYRMVSVARHQPNGVTATQYQEELLKQRHERIENKISTKEKSFKQQDDDTI